MRIFLMFFFMKIQKKFRDETWALTLLKTSSYVRPKHDTDLGKVVWKIISCQCCRFLLFMPPMFVQADIQISINNAVRDAGKNSNTMLDRLRDSITAGNESSDFSSPRLLCHAYTASLPLAYFYTGRVNGLRSFCKGKSLRWKAKGHGQVLKSGRWMNFLVDNRNTICIWI